MQRFFVSSRVSRAMANRGDSLWEACKAICSTRFHCLASLLSKALTGRLYVHSPFLYHRVLILRRVARARATFAEGSFAACLLGIRARGHAAMFATTATKQSLVLLTQTTYFRYSKVSMLSPTIP